MPRIKRIFSLSLPLIVMAGGAFASGAPGKLDLSGWQPMLAGFITDILPIAALLLFGCLVFGIFEMVTGRFMDGMKWVGGVVVGSLILGSGAAWVSSISGQSLGL